MADSTLPELARAYYRVFQSADRDGMEALLAPGFTFTSPWDDHIGRDRYFSHCFVHAGEFRFGADMQVFAQGDDVVVIYGTEGKQGGTFRNAELLRFENGQIASIEVFFGFIPGAREAAADEGAAEEAAIGEGAAG